MSKINGILSRLRGTIGEVTFAHKSGNNQTYARERVLENKSRTFAQMKQRVKWSNMARAYRAINGLVDRAFDGNFKREYNAFMSANSIIDPIYLTKQESEKGALVVGEFVVSKGPLTSINVTLDENHFPISNIKIGTLDINADTLYKDVCTEIVKNNSNIKEMDVITIIYLEQGYNQSLSIPVVDTRVQRLLIDLSCKSNPNAKFLSIINADFVKVTDGMWGCNFAVNGGITWIHARYSATGGMKCSTQNLVVHNPILEDYRTKEAMNKAIASYGGSEKEAYMAPGNDEWNEILENADSVTPSAPSTASQYTLTVNASPTNGGSVSGGGSYQSGVQATLTATPATGYRFTSWNDGSTQASRTVTVTESKTYTATFALISSGGGGMEQG